MFLSAFVILYNFHSKIETIIKVFNKANNRNKLSEVYTALVKNLNILHIKDALRFSNWKLNFLRILTQILR